MSPFAKAFFVAILSFSQTFLASSACQGDDCKVEAPQDEVSLIQTKMEPKQPHRPSDDMLDAAKEAIAEEVEEGKKQLRAYVDGLKSQGEAEAGERELRDYMNKTDEMGSCPGNFDMSISANAGVNALLQNGCLVMQDPAKMNGNQKTELNNCGKFNSASQAQGEFGWQQKSQPETGGICNSKAYIVKCPLPAACKSIALYRAYSDPPAWPSNCPQWGGYWGGASPAGMSKANYRKEYAICNEWNPTMNKIGKGYINEAVACGGGGAVVLIGNGEKVAACKAPSENYDFSKYLQIVMCRRPNNCQANTMSLTVTSNNYG